METNMGITTQSAAISEPVSHRTGSVTSKDGTTIGYLQVGHGPGLVLVQGAMGTAQNFTELGRALADAFSVYIPDRRGRGRSAAGGGDYGVQKEVDDLEALLNKTGAHNVFGLSSGAVISLQAVLRLQAIRRAAIYEPPLFIHGMPTALMQRYQEEMAQGKPAAALITAMQATQMGPAVFNFMPRWLLELLTDKMMKGEDKTARPDDVTMRKLAPTLQSDFQVVGELEGALESFKAIRAKVLLLGGSKSPEFLKLDLDVLEKVLPHARRIEFRGLGHSRGMELRQAKEPGRQAGNGGRRTAQVLWPGDLSAWYTDGLPSRIGVPPLRRHER